jgi:uncharacterized BrkB/YihY/UPF0761 family membrane protein
LLLWLYIAAFVVLLGAELNAELESRMAAERARTGSKHAARAPRRRARG